LASRLQTSLRWGLTALIPFGCGSQLKVDEHGSSLFLLASRLQTSLRWGLTALIPFRCGSQLKVDEHGSSLFLLASRLQTSLRCFANKKSRQPWAVDF